MDLATCIILPSLSSRGCTYQSLQESYLAALMLCTNLKDQCSVCTTFRSNLAAFKG